MTRLDRRVLALWLLVLLLGAAVMVCRPWVAPAVVEATPTSAVVTVMATATATATPTVLPDIFTVPPTTEADQLPIREPEPSRTPTVAPTSTPVPDPTSTPNRPPLQRG